MNLTEKEKDFLVNQIEGAFYTLPYGRGPKLSDPEILLLLGKLKA